VKPHRSAVLGLVALAGASCGTDFDPKSSVKTVRVLAVRADLPYARPGETVKLEALIHDARPPQGEPMKMYWFPFPCVDPPTGQYFGCYPGFEAIFPTKVDLSPYLVQASSTSITLPNDALARFQPRPGLSNEPTATAFVFFMACAGHVERVGRPTNQDPNALPVGCFNAGGRRLGQEDFIFGFTRVFVFATRRNALPTTSGILRGGQPIDAKAPLVIAPCTKEPCDKVELDIGFDDAIAETDPENVGPGGEQGRETIYVDWFTTVGKMGSDRRILFDPFLGRPPKTRVEFEPPREPGTGKLWAVLHDNRGGVVWVESALEIK
jgi:hypothetical protein